ncbi:MAG: (d)CMP kinase [Sphingobacteriales bacterium]|nr:MAG: (d)CMP kinase [Sphingobacteriales bacterium]
MHPRIKIAIDGFSSCGKSTLAKQLAKKLGYAYIDSGAMYRAVTLHFLRNAIDLNAADEVAQALQEIEISIVPGMAQDCVLLNGEDVTHRIREMLVAEKVSEVAAIKSVRIFAVAQQKALSQSGGVVMDGRDIGTVVFPDAELKIFMTADPAIRVVRRFHELESKKQPVTIEEVQRNLELRDYIDSNRDESPLRKAEDARVLDNTNLDPTEQLELALQWSRDAIHEKAALPA